MTPRFSRRDFVKTGALASGAVALGPGLLRALGLPESNYREPLDQRPPSQASQEVLVIGAGLAGLGAAWELVKAGHEVTVLEARSRPGGRVHTLREPFASDLFAEAGAVAYHEGYTQANRYIDELGLQRAEFAEPDLRSLYHLEGRRFSVGADEEPDWPYDLRPVEEGLSAGELFFHYADDVPQTISDPGSWSDPPLAKLDELTAADYLRKKGASEGAVAVIKHTASPGPFLESVSALSMFLVAELYGGPFVLKGGNDRLPRAMAERLSGSIRYGLEVTELRTTDAGVEVRARRGDRRETYRSDRAICTLPATVLRDIGFEPELPAEKRTAVHRLPYMHDTRTYLQVGRCFWYDEGVTGSAWTDLPIKEVARQPSGDAGAPDERAILESHVRGPSARRLGERSEAERVEDTLRHMEKVHPGVLKHQEGGVSKAWSEDPYALSAYSMPGAGDMTRYLDSLRRPHGRVHFAGEHTSVFRATMEGALRSGIRAAREVDEAAKEAAT